MAIQRVELKQERARASESNSPTNDKAYGLIRLMPSTLQSCPPRCYFCLLKCAHSVLTAPNRDPPPHMPRALVVHIEVFAHRRQFITAIAQDMFLFPTIANPFLTPSIQVSTHDLDAPASVNP